LIDNGFDPELLAIGHFARYPTLMPWVGAGYRQAPIRIMVLGESHYLEPTNTLHHDPQSWYAGLDLAGMHDLPWMNTRGIIANGIDNRWKQASKTIYRNIANALDAGDFNFARCANAFLGIAFMNYFQRPAERSGHSIKVRALDIERSAEVLEKVVQVLQPDLLIVCSSLAWRAARSRGLIDALRKAGVLVKASTHPSSSWWNRPSRRLHGATGKRAFMLAVAEGMAGRKPVGA